MRKQLKNLCLAGNKLIPSMTKNTASEDVITWRQFKHHFTHTFLYKSKLSSFSLITFGFGIFGAKILYKKCACKMLMKLTPGVNFANISTTTFWWHRLCQQLYLAFLVHSLVKQWQCINWRDAKYFLGALVYFSGPEIYFNKIW